MSKKKYFGTDGIRGKVGSWPINPEFALKLGWAVGKVLARPSGAKVLIGKDTRISGYMFESALEAGLSAAGVDVHLLGPMPTPGIAYLTRTLRASAGIVISASHNPYYDNGIKFFSDQGYKLPDEIELAIEEQLEKTLVTVESKHLGKAVRLHDAPGRYIEFCKSTFPSHLSLKGMKIIVDCANGASYYVAPNVFHELNANVLELAVNPDGLNINDHCGSTCPEVLQKIVLAEKADCGIALDGDGDRVIMCDEEGEILDGDELLFIIAKNLQQLGKLRGGVVGTSMSNLGLEQALQNLGIAFIRTHVGDRYVMSELLRLGWQLGGESSGHIVWLGVTTTGDGIISALQVLSCMQQTGKSLHELKKELIKFPQSMINVKFDSKKNPLDEPQIVNAIKETERALEGRGRVLLRASGTESSVVRVMVEGEDAVHVNTLAQALAELVKQVR
ncbi:MAG: phosphoglucosamine mutase [Gammaproteobacteria bacterium RIFCSPLOWO2_02_FULL_38_11]|nr:MAG: phosphoglucosamine mutase [Gammaproteobacteria bacterium RIFCSPLOWO2_02_FULL_38_11]